jgi:hypothetical protein
MVGRKFHQFTDERRRAAVVDEPAAMKLPGGVFGPWRPGIDEAERRAGLRTLAGLTLVFAGSGQAAVTALLRAETLPETMGRALLAFDRIPTRQRRNIVASYARFMRPLRSEDGP